MAAVTATLMPRRTRSPRREFLTFLAPASSPAAATPRQLAGAAGLTAREWGFSFDGFGGHGHALVEVYDRGLSKWVFLDVYNNIQALDAATGAGRWRTVDWIVLDVKSVFFSDPRPEDNTHGNFISHRPEDSISSSHLALDFLYRISDTTAVIYDGVYDWNRGNIGTSNVSLADERLPRLATFVG